MAHRSSSASRGNLKGCDVLEDEHEVLYLIPNYNLPKGFRAIIPNDIRVSVNLSNQRQIGQLHKLCSWQKRVCFSRYLIYAIEKFVLNLPHFKKM